VQDNYCRLEIVPSSEKDIHIGDIIAYRTEDGLIVHRVVNKTTDKTGKTFFILQGDNNSKPDPINVSFEDIEYKLVGVLY